MCLVGRFLKNNSLKLHCQMNRNLVGSIHGISLLRLLMSFRSVNKHGSRVQFLFLVGRFLKILSSETAWSNELNFFLFLYCRILPVNKYHLVPGFQVMKLHKNIISFTINLILNYTNKLGFVTHFF